MTYTNPKEWAGVSQSTNKPHPGAFIVYINGLEVPAKSVSQRFGVWQTPEMQVEMVADPVLTRLGTEDRIQVVVFYLDDTQPAKIEPQFRLFGEGEITAWGYQNTPGGRSIVFTVINQIVILKQLMVQFLTQVDDYAAYELNPNTTTLGTVTSQITFPYSLFTDGLLRTNTGAESAQATGVTTASQRIEAATSYAYPTTTRPMSFDDQQAWAVVVEAWSYRNVPYDLGSSPNRQSIDCSGLVRTAYKVIGFDEIKDPTQRVFGDAENMRENVGYAVDKENMAPGDIMAIDTGRKHDHVGIYDGQGRVIHASSHRGRVVREPLKRWKGNKKIWNRITAKRVFKSKPAPLATPTAEVPPVAEELPVVTDPATRDADGTGLWDTDFWSGSPDRPDAEPPPVLPDNYFTSAGTGVRSQRMPNAIQRPFDYLFNVVKAMLEKKVPSAVRTIPAANFFARWARLTNFVNRFTAFPVFDEMRDHNVFPALKALQGVNALDVLVQRLLPQIQSAGTLFDMLQLVYQQVFMEIAMLPMMPLVRTDLLTGVIEPTPFEEHVLVQDPSNTQRYVTKNPLLPLKPNRLPNYFAKPQMLFGIPPSCNVIFPSEIKMLSYTENYMTQPTRIYFNDETVNDLLKSQGTIRTAISNALAIGYPSPVDQGNQARIAGGTVNGKNFLLFPEEFFKGPVMDRRPVPPWLFFLRSYQDALNIPAPPGVVRGTPTTAGGTSVSGSDASAANSTAAPFSNTDIIEKCVWPLTVSADDRTPIVTKRYQDYLNEARATEQGAFVAGIDFSYPHATKDKYLPVGKRPAGYVQNERVSKDSAMPEGTMCVAVGPGRVMLAENWKSGWSVRIEHDGGQWQSFYTYMKKTTTPLVKLGDRVLAGTPLGEVGYHPKDSNKVYGVHLCLYDRDHGGVAVDPASYVAQWSKLAAPVIPTTGASNAPASTTAQGPLPAPAPTIDAPVEIDAATYARLTELGENVYELYAKYEYYRERYAQRSGTAHLSWNPYVVPGFPAAFFDQRSTRVDVFAYITTVQQRMSWRARSTDVTFVYGRTIQEVFGLLRHEFEGGSTILGNCPQEPIREVRKVVQDFKQAETMYQKLFFGGRSIHRKNASFDWRKIIGFAPELAGGLPEPIFITGLDETSKDLVQTAATHIVSYQPAIEELKDKRDKARRQWGAATAILEGYLAPPAPPSTDVLEIIGQQFQQAKEFLLPLAIPARKTEAERNLQQANITIASTTRELEELKGLIEGSQAVVDAEQIRVSVRGLDVVSNVTGDREVVPLPSAEPMFQEYDAAMAYNWRPICTLDEYIIFHDAAGEGPIAAAGEERSLGARYFKRIRRMTPLTPSYTFPIGADGLPNAPQSAVPLGAEASWGDLSKTLYAVIDYIPFPQPTDTSQASISEARELFTAALKTAGVLEAQIAEIWVQIRSEMGDETPVQQSTTAGKKLTWTDLKNVDPMQVYQDVMEQVRKGATVEAATREFESQAAIQRARDVENADAEATKDYTRVPGIHSGTGAHGTNGPNDFPQTRADWDTILEAYRNNVYNVKAPRG